MTTKELVLLCAGGTKGVLEVKEKDTLADVRIKIDKELDDDLIVPDFAYYVDGVRISQKQECKRFAWQVLDKFVSLRAKHSRYDLDHTATTITSMALSAKKVKVEDCDSNASQTNPQSSLNNTSTSTSTSALGMDVEFGVRRVLNLPTKPNPISGDAGNPNDESESALETSLKVLNSVKSMLEENSQFCSIDRRNEWINEIEGILTMSSPKTTVGVLGNTGVGKVSVELYTSHALVDWTFF